MSSFQGRRSVVPLHSCLVGAYLQLSIPTSGAAACMLWWRPRFQIMRSRVIRRWITAGWFVVALWAQQPGTIAQKIGQVFVGLTAPDGTPVTDLQVGEVGISEDGVECRVLKLEPIDWPTKVQVLVDNGRATTEAITNLRHGLTGLLERIPDGAEISLY